MSSQQQIGQLVGNYRLVRKIGEGGMSVVYEARHEYLARRAAVKLVHPRLSHNVEVAARFRREARALDRLCSQHIVKALDFGTLSSQVAYLVMEYVEGVNLRSLLDRHQRLPLDTSLNLVLQVCEGLRVAHAAGIVHRDLKPENLILTRSATAGPLVKILDFGIAKVDESGHATGITQTGASIGTAYYMAPEQIRGRKDLDCRADIYAVGVLLYEVLSGQKPHIGGTREEVLANVLYGRSRPLESLCPELPSGLTRAVSRALAQEPDARPGSVEELVRELSPAAKRLRAAGASSHAANRAIFELADTQALPASATQLGVVNSGSSPPTAAASSVTIAGHSIARRPVRWLATSVGTVGAIGFSAWRLMHGVPIPSESVPKEARTQAARPSTTEDFSKLNPAPLPSLVSGAAPTAAKLALQSRSVERAAPRGKPGTIERGIMPLPSASAAAEIAARSVASNASANPGAAAPSTIAHATSSVVAFSATTQESDEPSALEENPYTRKAQRKP